MQRTAAVKTSKAALAALALATLCVSLLSGHATARAQTKPPDVTAYVDDSDISLSEMLTLTIEISDIPNARAPALPPIDGLILTGTSVSSVHTVDNGVYSAVSKFQYRFQPTRTGVIEIDPIEVRAGGAVLHTDPITVTVRLTSWRDPTTLRQSPDGLGVQEFFSQAFVDDEAPYIGEQITHTFKFFSTDTIRRPTYNAPDFAGFWNKGQTVDDIDNVLSNGKRYAVTEIETILFPQLAGDIAIEPGSMSVQTGFFGSRKQDIESERIVLNVRQLPANEPPSFTGAVGKYRISASADASAVELGEPLSLTVEIRGEGNFETLPEPAWQPIAGWRAFDRDTNYRMGVADGNVRGVRTFERALVPDVSGDYELPPIDYSYFDPDLEEYVTVSTEPLSVHVLAGPGGAAEPPAAGAVDDADAIEDIRYNKPPPPSIGVARPPLSSNGAFLALWAAPIVVALASLAWIAAHRVRAMAAARAAEPPDAAELALARLAELEPGASASDAAASALRAYLDAALGRPSGGIPPEEIAARLESLGASAATAARVADALAAIDEMRFAPAGMADSRRDAREIADVVRALDGELSR